MQNINAVFTSTVNAIITAPKTTNKTRTKNQKIYIVISLKYSIVTTKKVTKNDEKKTVTTKTNVKKTTTAKKEDK